jgi:hypothetical protein
METNTQLQTTENPVNLISLAIQKGVDINQLEKLLSLKERYDAIQSHKAFLSALSSFQKDVPTIQKKKTVGYKAKNGSLVGYKYAELGEIDEAIKEALAANGLSKRWEIAEEGEKLICTCVISHIDGHTERTSMSSLKDSSGNKNDIQSRASAVTYLQRYTLIGALGLTTASDDDDAGEDIDQPTINNHHAETELPWLNVFDKSGNKTPDGVQVFADLASGKITLEQLQQQYKISKSTLNELQQIKVVKHQQGPTKPVSITEPDNTPFIIPGNWHAKAERWQNVEDVIATYNDKVATINATPELQTFVFKEAMNVCKTKGDILKLYNAAKTTINASPELQKILKERQSKFSKELTPVS